MSGPSIRIAVAAALVVTSAAGAVLARQFLWALAFFVEAFTALALLYGMLGWRALGGLVGAAFAAAPIALVALPLSSGHRLPDADLSPEAIGVLPALVIEVALSAALVVAAAGAGGIADPVLAAALAVFVLGLHGILTRRSARRVLIGVALMTNGAVLALAGSGGAAVACLFAGVFVTEALFAVALLVAVDRAEAAAGEAASG